MLSFAARPKKLMPGLQVLPKELATSPRFSGQCQLVNSGGFHI